jgi:O-antigen/teichoic acid export membrane protein
LLSAGAIWLRTGLASAAVFLYGPSLTSVSCGFLLSALVIVGFATTQLVRELRQSHLKTFSASMFKSMLIYGLPFGIWSVSAWAQHYADRYLVEMALGGAVLGAYVAAVQLAAFPFTWAGSVFSQFVTPITFEVAGSGREEWRLTRASRSLTQLLTWFMAAGLAVVLLYAIAGPMLMSALTHRDYAVSASVLAMLALGALLTATAQQLTTVLLARNRSDTMIGCKIVPGVVGLSLVWFLARRFGLIGAALGYAATGAVFLLIVLVTMRKLEGRSAKGLDGYEQHAG